MNDNRLKLKNVQAIQCYKISASIFNYRVLFWIANAFISNLNTTTNNLSDIFAYASKKQQFVATSDYLKLSFTILQLTGKNPG